MSDKLEFTWKDLKEFANSLPETELDKKVRWWGDEIGGTIKSAFVLNEDYGDQGGHCLEPRSVYVNERNYEADEFKVDLPKGTPMLKVD